MAVSSYPVLPVVKIPNNSNFNKQNHCFSLRELVNIYFIIIAEIFNFYNLNKGFPSGSMVKNPLASAGDTSLISDLGRFSGGGNGNPLRYSFLGNPMDREAWQATVHGVSKMSRT